MKFVTVRDLRLKPRQVWERLARDKEMIITSNGKPIALLTQVKEDNFEQTLAVLRRARALMAIEEMQRASLAAGTDRMSGSSIEAEIRAVRRSRAGGGRSRPQRPGKVPAARIV